MYSGSRAARCARTLSTTAASTRAASGSLASGVPSSGDQRGHPTAARSASDAGPERRSRTSKRAHGSTADQAISTA
jgi:hypothetical protein